MQIEIVHVNDEGSGQCIVHKDDGGTFAIIFRNAPVNDYKAFIAHLEAKATESIMRDQPTASIDAKIMQSIGGRISIQSDDQKSKKG